MLIVRKSKLSFVVCVVCVITSEIYIMIPYSQNANEATSAVIKIMQPWTAKVSKKRPYVSQQIGLFYMDRGGLALLPWCAWWCME